MDANYIEAVRLLLDAIPDMTAEFPRLDEPQEVGRLEFL